MFLCLYYITLFLSGTAVSYCVCCYFVICYYKVIRNRKNFRWSTGKRNGEDSDLIWYYYYMNHEGLMGFVCVRRNKSVFAFPVYVGFFFMFKKGTCLRTRTGASFLQAMMLSTSAASVINLFMT